MTATPDMTAWISVGLLTEEVIRRFPAALRNPPSRALWSVFALFDVSLVTKFQKVGDVIYDITSLSESATLIKHVAGVAGVAALLRWVRRVVPGRMEGRAEPGYMVAISSNPRRIITWAVVAAMTAAFPFAQLRTGNQQDSDFIFIQAGHLWGSLHLLLFYSYVIFGFVCASMMSSAAAREPSAKGAFKAGMQMVSLGCGFGAFYGILRSGYLITRLCDKPFLGGDGFVDVASSFSLDGCVLLVVGGMAAPKLDRAKHLIKAHGAVYDLRPLWLALTRAVPTAIYADEVPHRRPGRISDLKGRLYDFWNWKHLDLRLRKRITEIFDASLALAPYAPPALRDCAEQTAREFGLPPYAVTAFLLRTAIQRKSTHATPLKGQCEPLLQARSDLFTTTAELLPVGHAMNNSVQMSLLDRRAPSDAHA
ncbi:MAB_1171c family putative transporter [Streptomyces sp. NPDC048281]|uniref:MAB_1171c family putative transporter n=1 Tax=Streptomyces sp. NPDC048281 TaxID=3154715 RepID=UPI00341B59B1